MIFNELRSGSSVEGDEIKAFRSTTKADKYIYLMAGVHGDEVEGVFVTSKLFSWLQDEHEAEIPLIVIPVLNVDGHRNGTRVNSHGVDLNRNLDTECWESEAREVKYFPGSAPLSEPENQFLVKLFEKFPPAFILSVHSWKPIVNYNGDCEDVAEYMSKKNGYPTADDIGYPTPGSLGTYGSKNLDCPVLTFECPTIEGELKLQDVWDQNEEAFKGLFTDKVLERFLS